MPARHRAGGRSLGLSEMRELLRDQRVWCGLGIVVKRSGEDSHFEIADGDVLVDVDLMPRGEPLLCRLGTGTQGVWKVPAEGSEVMVLVPEGAFEADPMIAGVLSTGTVDDDLDGDTLVIVNAGKVLIKSDDQVILGGNSGSKVARDGDHADAGTLSISVTGSAVLAGTYTDPDGTVFTAAGSSLTATLKAKISEGSSKVKAAD